SRPGGEIPGPGPVKGVTLDFAACLQSVHSTESSHRGKLSHWIQAIQLSFADFCGTKSGQPTRFTIATRRPLSECSGAHSVTNDTLSWKTFSTKYSCRLLLQHINCGIP